MRNVPVLWFLFGAAATLAPAHGRAEDIDTDAACAALAAIEVPAADQPDAAARARMLGCDSEALYYGIEQPADFVDARLCAYVENEEPDDAPPFAGASVLMLIYANGRGVARNIPLAKKFACHVDGAPAELEGRLEHLDELAKQSTPAEPMDYCDDVTSGMMMGYCAHHDEQIRSLERNASLDAITARWPVEQQAAYKTLKDIADDYFQASVDGEVDVSGTGRTAFSIFHGAQFEDEFLAMLQEFESGKLPQGDAASLKVADVELNERYAATLKAATPDPGDGFSELGTVRPEGIRTTERAWLRYRDAWVKFGKIKYPDVSADAWLDYFTRQRVKSLKELTEVPE